jgi:hypothetical protein
MIGKRPSSLPLGSLRFNGVLPGCVSNSLPQSSRGRTTNLCELEADRILGAVSAGNTPLDGLRNYHDEARHEI